MNALAPWFHSLSLPALGPFSFRRNGDSLDRSKMAPQSEGIEGCSRRKLADVSTDMLRATMGACKATPGELFRLAFLNEKSVGYFLSAMKALHTTVSREMTGLNSRGSIVAQVGRFIKGLPRMIGEPRGIRTHSQDLMGVLLHH